MRIFDTKVQELKYRVLKEVAKHAWEGDLLENVMDIPKIIVPGKIPTMRCCVYKERAILGERVKAAMGGDKMNPNVIEVIDIACDECPAAGYEVTNSCRGCLAHHCEGVCPRGAISFDSISHQAHIDKTKCVECGQCAKACPYSAIVNRKRPCQNACKVKAIAISEDGAAEIDNNKCISCGACVYQCPFGAITDKSSIVDVIDIIRTAFLKRKKVHAIVAPAIASQFSYAKLGQVVAGIKELGIAHVAEAALGADMVSKEESKELVEKGFLSSSCCPAYVKYVSNTFPDMVQYVSHNMSPMAVLGKFIKESHPDDYVIFIGPCTAKKMEIKREEVKPYVDYVLTFEELQALLDSRDIDITQLPEDDLSDASYYGRIFARSGGLSESVKQALKEQGLENFEVKPVICNGISECHVALVKKSKNALDANFIEGMACIGGCIGGAGNMTHGIKGVMQVNNYGKAAGDKTILGSVEAVMPSAPTDSAE